MVSRLGTAFAVLFAVKSITAFLFVWLLTPTLIFAKSLSEHRRDNLLIQGLGPLQPNDSPATIRGVSRFESIWTKVKQFLDRTPSLSEMNDYQIRAIHLLREIRDPIAFESLLRVSRFDRGIPAVVQYEARLALVDLLPIFTDDQQKEIRETFHSDLNARVKYHQLKDGSLGPLGRQAKEEMERLISMAQDQLRPRVEAGSSSPNLCGLHFVEAGKALVRFPTDVICSSLRSIVEDPVHTPTQFAWGMVMSLKEAVLDVPANLAGISTAGAYGNAGSQLGQSLANQAAWALPIRELTKAKKFRAFKSNIKEIGIPALKAGVSPFAATKAFWFYHDFMNQVAFIGMEFSRLNCKAFKSQIGESLKTKFSVLANVSDSLAPRFFELHRDGKLKEALNYFQESRGEIIKITQEFRIEVRRAIREAKDKESLGQLGDIGSLLDEILKLSSETILYDSPFSRRSFALEQMVHDWQSWYRKYTKSPIDMRLELQPELQLIPIEPLSIRRILSNLVDNSQQAGATEVTIRTECDVNGMRLFVADNGHGISADVSPYLSKDGFHPSKAGAGYGLPTVKALVEEGGGTLEFQEGNPKGTVAKLSWNYEQLRKASENRLADSAKLQIGNASVGVMKFAEQATKNKENLMIRVVGGEFDHARSNSKGVSWWWESFDSLNMTPTEVVRMLLEGRYPGHILHTITEYVTDYSHASTPHPGIIGFKSGFIEGPLEIWITTQSSLFSQANSFGGFERAAFSHSSANAEIHGVIRFRLWAKRKPSTSGIWTGRSAGYPLDNPRYPALLSPPIPLLDP